jgi:hypothetical protein
MCTADKGRSTRGVGTDHAYAGLQGPVRQPTSDMWRRLRVEAMAGL